jgi:hypothetical protein
MPDKVELAIIEGIIKGQVGPPTTIITLANGLNSNIPLPATERVRIVGPTAAFSVGSIVSGGDGRILRFYSTVLQTCTIVDQDSSATSASSRITTLKAANVALRATGLSFFTLGYDGTDNRWILESTNGGAL